MLMLTSAMKFTSVVIFIFWSLLVGELSATDDVIKTEFKPSHPELNADCQEEGECNRCKSPFEWCKSKETCYLPQVNKCSRTFSVETNTKRDKPDPRFRALEEDGIVYSTCSRKSCEIFFGMKDACSDVGDGLHATIIRNLTIIEKNAEEITFLRDGYERFSIKPQKALAKMERNTLRFPAFRVKQNVTVDIALNQKTASSVRVTAKVCCRPLPSGNPNIICPKDFFSIPSSESCYKALHSLPGTDDFYYRMKQCRDAGSNGHLAFIETEKKSQELAEALHYKYGKQLYGQGDDAHYLLIGLRRNSSECSSPFVWTDGQSETPLSYFPSLISADPGCEQEAKGCLLTTFDYEKMTNVWHPVKCCDFSSKVHSLCEVTPTMIVNRI